ncbi:MAG: chlorite dismutase family protein [Candidatus Methylacidiphilales bacterium]|nr:chlorite dismutase family protein [Candidatus Methylacidiphilales bacterium]
MPPLYVSFVAGAAGKWKIETIKAATGETLPCAGFLDIRESSEPNHRAGAPPQPPPDGWVLRGVVSNLRYTTRAEVEELKSRQEGLGRPAATRAALIPIRKSEAWWALSQDERRRIFEEQSRHTTLGMQYLPAIARRLHHSRELGEPFDFLTWFEYAPEHISAFEDLVAQLRQTEEWQYVTREVDIRLSAVQGLE